MSIRPESVAPEILVPPAHQEQTRAGSQTPVPSNAMAHVPPPCLQIHPDTEKHAFRFQTGAGRQAPALFYVMASVAPHRHQTQVVRAGEVVVEVVGAGWRPI